MFPMRVWAGFPARPVGIVCVLAMAFCQMVPSRLWGKETGDAMAADFITPHVAPSHPDLRLSKENARKAEALAHFIKGAIAEENAETDEALAEYERVLDLDPSCADIAVKVAFELAKRGEVAEGINTLKDAIKVSPKNPLLILYLSQLYARHLKKYDIAIRYAKEALEMDPGTIAAHACLYDLYTVAGDAKSARATLDRALKAESSSADFWLQLADLAIRAVQKATQPDPVDMEKVMAFLSKARAAAGSDLESMGKVADFYLLLRQEQPAIELYRKIIAADPESEKPSTANAEDKLARALHAGNRREEAIAVLERMASKHPERHDTHEMLGELLEENGDLEGALQSFRSSLLLDPNQPLNHLRVADILIRLNRPKEAVDQLRLARDRFPDLPQVTYYLAVALDRAARHGESLAMFEAAISESQRTNPQLLNAEFYFNYGAAAERGDQLDLAAELFQKSIELDPQDAARAYNYLGYTWVDRNIRLEEARKLIEKALELDPDNPAYLDSLGWYHYRKGEYGQALALLKRALGSIAPEEASAVYEHLGDTYSAMNQNAEALEAWRKAAELDPENQVLAEKIRSAGSTPAPANDPGNLR